MASFEQNDIDYCVNLALVKLDPLVAKDHPGCSIQVFREVYEEACEKAEDYLGNLRQPNIIKVAGYYGFWLRKLKPFYVATSDGECSMCVANINELASLMFGSILISQKSHLQDRLPLLSADFINDLVASLRFNTFSPQSLTMLFQALNESWKEPETGHV